MSLKISANMSAVAHHILTGAFTFPYAVDAHSAVSRFPDEWSHEPWSMEAIERARREAGEELEPLSPEEQEAIEEHARAVAEANERLAEVRRRKAAEKAEADQIAADEALVRSAPPQVARRPFGRKGDPTAAELELIKKREAKKEADERIVREKAEQDAQAAAKGAPITR
jgi:hypothetical protein